MNESRRLGAMSPRRIAALATAFALNLFFLLGALFLMQPVSPLAGLPRGLALQVRLIEPAHRATARALDIAVSEPPVPPPTRALVRRVRHAKPLVSTKAGTEPAATATNERAHPSPLQIFNADGSVHLSVDAPAVPAAVGFPERPTSAAGIALFQRGPILPYQPTRFESLWGVPLNETLAGELVRRTTVSHTWRTPWGTQVSCAFTPIVPLSLFGCGWGMAPRATIEELQRMRADPPPSPPTADGNDVAPTIP